MATENMELKDVILSTLAEMEQGNTQEQTSETSTPAKPMLKNDNMQEPKPQPEHSATDEALFLESVRERLLVLFEGFQSPNNTQIEAKVDLTLNFLEYLLSAIDARLEKNK